MIKMFWVKCTKFQLKNRKSQEQWSTLIPALGRQRWADLCEFKAGLVYIASSRPGGTKGRPCLKNTKKIVDCGDGYMS